MRVIHQASGLAPGDRGVCVAIGMFDGVHLGHQRVLNDMLADARAHGCAPVALTFDKHPNAVVAPERTPRLIYSLSQRLRVMDGLGVETALLIHFDRTFSQQPAETFIRGLAQDFRQIHSICVGSDFTFGYRRSGNVPLLRKLGQELGFTVHDSAAVSWDGKTVSSTRIREAIQKGDLGAISAMLGRPYSISGSVVPGEQLGRRLGFPTANLAVAGLALPPTGVYAGYAITQATAHQAVANLGYRPTVHGPAPELRFEVHLLDFAGDLYGQELEFAFVKGLRGEQQFASVEALKEQIERDAVTARAVLAQSGPAPARHML